jgi:uncharacterized protein (DUF488 family)
MNPIFTIGHSNHPIEVFLGLLQQHAISCVVDVRSVPFSRFYPQFNKERLATTLEAGHILYEFEGERLGGRIQDKSCFLDRQLPQRKVNVAELVDYGVLVQRDWFVQGMDHLVERGKTARIAILCSEEQPDRCHRNLLIARYLLDAGLQVFHIRGNGNAEPAAFCPQSEQMRLL